MIDRKPLARIPEKRHPRTFWLTDSEHARVMRLARDRDDDAIGRKALMLGISMLESGWSREASITSGR